MSLNPVRVDFEGRTPIPRWQLVTALTLILLTATVLVGNMVGLFPAAQTGAEATARVEASVEELKTEQADLRDEQVRLRQEMRRGFAEIKKLLEAKDP